METKRGGVVVTQHRGEVKERSEKRRKGRRCGDHPGMTRASTSSFFFVFCFFKRRLIIDERIWLTCQEGVWWPQLLHTMQR